MMPKRKQLDLGLFVVLVFGSREYDNRKKLYSKLNLLDATQRIDIVLQGGARGADTMGEDWARENERICIRVPAEWTRFRRSAGPIRNQRMLDLFYPSYALGFHEDIEKSKGSKDMAKRIEKENIPHKFYFDLKG